MGNGRTVCIFFFLMEKKVSTSSFSIYNFLVTKMFNSFFFQIAGSEVNAVCCDTRHASELSKVTAFIYWSDVDSQVCKCPVMSCNEINHGVFLKIFTVLYSYRDPRFQI